MDVCWHLGSADVEALATHGFPDIFFEFPSGVDEGGSSRTVLRLPPLNYMWLGDWASGSREGNWCFG